MTTPRYIDSHCHLDFSAFDRDREAVWRRCRERGIQSLVIPGVTPAQWSNAKQCSEHFDGVFYSLGLHPWWIQDYSETCREKKCGDALLLDSLKQQLAPQSRSGKCVAIGECGLDKTINTPISEQRRFFDLHLTLAQETSLPVIVHSVKAHAEVIAALKNTPVQRGGVIHGFSGSTEIAEAYWSMGFYLGIGGTITYQRAQKTRASVRRLPLESIVLETDAPDMPINGKQGERNSPEYLITVAESLAYLRGNSLEEIAAQTTHNARRLFRLSG